MVRPILRRAAPTPFLKPRCVCTLRPPPAASALRAARSHSPSLPSHSPTLAPSPVALCTRRTCVYLSGIFTTPGASSVGGPAPAPHAVSAPACRSASAAPRRAVLSATPLPAASSEAPPLPPPPPAPTPRPRP
eukprot:5465368-Prymnesium_polylepis.1